MTNFVKALYNRRGIVLEVGKIRIEITPTKDNEYIVTEYAKVEDWFIPIQIDFLDMTCTIECCMWYIKKIDSGMGRIYVEED